MQWINVGLYHAKAIKAVKKRVQRGKRKAAKKALLEEARKYLRPADIQAEVQRLVTQRANRVLGIKPEPRQVPVRPQYPQIPKYRPGMAGEDFYQTREWKELRYAALVRYNRTCQCCGATDTIIHVDHIKPRSKYPELELDSKNLQLLCEPCNIGKSNKDMTDWRSDTKAY